MQMTTWYALVCGLFLLPVPPAAAQPQNPVDVLPLAIGNEWTFRFQSSEWDNSITTLSDSGVAACSVVDSIDAGDSIRWVFRERREVWRCIRYYFDPARDSCWSATDSTLFELVELLNGNHRLYRTETEEAGWRSAFPWSHELTDTTAVYRFAVVDSAGRSVFSTHPSGQAHPRTYDITMLDHVGPLETRIRTSPWVTGIGYRADYFLERYSVAAVHDSPEKGQPAILHLYQNYPNPFNASTHIVIRTDAMEHVRLGVFNVLGQEVALLFEGFLSPGVHSFPWDASSLPGGIYYYRALSGDRVFTGRALFIK
jgi:hypothetical protein